MSKKCPWCDSIGSLVDDAEFEGRLYCKNCNTSILMGEELDCNLFDRITASPETLAAELVFWGHDKDGEWYTSHLLDEDYHTEAEAIAATVAKLKEVCND